MADVPLGILQVSWLDSEENFVHAVRRQTWNGVVEEANKEVEKIFVEPAKAAAFKSVSVLSCIAQSKASELTKKLHRQLYEVGLRKCILDALVSVYPKGVANIGATAETAASLIHSNGVRISAVQIAVKILASILEPLHRAANGTEFANIPFFIYHAIVYILSKKPESHVVSWWKNRDNRKIVLKVACKAWPKLLEVDKRAKIEKGWHIIATLVDLLTNFVPREITIFEAKNHMKEAVRKHQSNLKDGINEGDECHVLYLEPSENKHLIKYIKALNHGLGSALETEWVSSEHIVTLLRKKKIGGDSDLECQVYMRAYFDKVVLSSVVSTSIMATGVKVWAAIVTLFLSLKDDQMIHAELAKTRSLDNLRPLENFHATRCSLLK